MRFKEEGKLGGTGKASKVRELRGAQFLIVVGGNCPWASIVVQKARSHFLFSLGSVSLSRKWHRGTFVLCNTNTSHPSRSFPGERRLSSFTPSIHPSIHSLRERALFLLLYSPQLCHSDFEVGRGSSCFKAKGGPGTGALPRADAPPTRCCPLPHLPEPLNPRARTSARAGRFPLSRKPSCWGRERRRPRGLFLLRLVRASLSLGAEGGGDWLLALVNRRGPSSIAVWACGVNCCCRCCRHRGWCSCGELAGGRSSCWWRSDAGYRGAGQRQRGKDCEPEWSPAEAAALPARRRRAEPRRR